eukprot:TRINITY_DN15633_c0_g1_i3.p1 TRINITY_DN15633_c0_g1~~TRINITY_DN15633_c0_g1_i3.p1  ORF type:complete len:358 (+),score=72.40 TRINITY_DN15633_c0_g1_i3:76-1149(+)
MASFAVCRTLLALLAANGAWAKQNGESIASQSSEHSTEAAAEDQGASEAVTQELAPSTLQPCADLNAQCAYWAAIGECEKNPRYMLTMCQISCHTCPGDNTAMNAKIYRELESLAADPASSQQPQAQSQKKKLQLREISFSPRAFIVDDFLSAEECEGLKQHALPHLEHAKTINMQTGQYQDDKVRTNSQMYVNKTSHFEDPLISSIVERLHVLARVPFGHAEQLQVGRYQQGQFYQPHFDSEPRQNVNRVATVIMYLEEPDAGGETVFPKRRSCGGQAFQECCAKRDELVVGEGHGFWVAGKKGQAVLFYSHDLDGKQNPYSLHGSCPVLAGEKWIAQQWFRVKPYDRSPHYRAAE